MSTLDSQVAALAATQYGLITRAQASEIGITSRMIDNRLTTGRWVRVHKNVYRIAGTPRTWESRALAAVLSASCDAVLSHRCAAHIWGLEGFGPPGIIDVTASRHACDGHRFGIRMHESKAFHLRAEVRHKGIPCTGVARTILDVCAVVESDIEALTALDCALRRHIVSWDELWRCLVLHAARGRNGIARYRRILLRRHGKRVPHMKIAAMTLELIVDAGLPEPESEVWALGRRYRIDLAYPELKVAIECLGKDGHLNDASFESDPVRRNELQLDGWIVIEVTWQRLVDEPHLVVRDVRRAIALRTGAG